MAQPSAPQLSIPDYDRLKARHRSLRETFPEPLNLRIHRAISWLGRAEAEKDDADVRFILLWVAFNSAYAGELCEAAENERSAFNTYFDALVSLDATHRIYNAVWKRFPHEIRLLLNNKYVFAPFWKHHNGREGHEDWAEKLEASRRGLAAYMARRDTVRILSTLFDRLYVLRNQLVHGGATWNSAVNRNQVRDGAAVIGWLLPVFIDIMMDDAARDWGRPYYPVVD